MKTFSVFLLCFFAITFHCAYSQLEKDEDFQCPLADIRKMDKTVEKMISFTKNVRLFPETRANLTSYCKKTNRDLNFLVNENDRCLLGTAKRFTRVILSSVRTFIGRLCENRNSKKRTNEILNISRCINSLQAEGDVCMTSFYDYLQRGKRAEPEEIRIGYACCGYHTLVECITKAAEAVKRSTDVKKNATACSKDTPELTRDFINNLFAAIMNVACGSDWSDENSDQCDKLPVPPPKTKEDRRAISFFLPLVELYNSL